MSRVAGGIVAPVIVDVARSTKIDFHDVVWSWCVWARDKNGEAMRIHFDEMPEKRSAETTMSGVPRSDLRRGILEVETWTQLLKTTLESWKTNGGCLLTGESNVCPDDAPFNYWSVEAQIDFEDDAIPEEGAKVVGDHTGKAKIIYSSLPYLDRNSVRKRPSLFVFSVTGHVVLGIYFGNLLTPELHILNPWRMIGDATQMADIYRLFEVKLGPVRARKIIYIDVAGEIETAKGKTINLQKDELVGFCTLWVAIIASKVIPLIGDLGRAIGDKRGASQLSVTALSMYYDKVYKPLMDDVAAAQKVEDPTIGETSMNFTSFKAAAGVNKLAKEALTIVTVTGGKRTNGRRTYRRKPQCKHQGQRSSSRHRTRRSAKRRG